MKFLFTIRVGLNRAKREPTGHRAVRVAQSQTEVPDIAPHPQRAVATGTTDTEPELGTASNPQPVPGRTK